MRNFKDAKELRECMLTAHRILYDRTFRYRLEKGYPLRIIRKIPVLPIGPAEISHLEPISDGYFEYYLGEEDLIMCRGEVVGVL